MGAILRSALFASLIAGVMVPSVLGAGEEERRYVIPFHGMIVLDVPEGWTDRLERASTNAPPTIRFESERGDDFTIALSVVWNPEGDRSFNDLPALRGMVDSAIESLRETAKETEIPVEEIADGEVRGYYFSITDKVEQLPPDEFRYLTQGALALDDLLISFAILTQPETRSVERRALKMIRGISRPSARRGDG